MVSKIPLLVRVVEAGFKECFSLLSWDAFDDAPDVFLDHFRHVCSLLMSENFTANDKLVRGTSPKRMSVTMFRAIPVLLIISSRLGQLGSFPLR